MTRVQEASARGEWRFTLGTGNELERAVSFAISVCR